MIKRYPRIHFRLAMLTLALMLTPFVSSPASAAQTSPDELLQRAKEVRSKAEQELAEARKRHLEEREELAAELNEQYDELDAARERVKNAQEKLSDLQDRLSMAQQEAERLKKRERSLFDRLEDGLRLTIDSSAELEKLRAQVDAAVEDRLERVREGLRVETRTEQVVGRHGNQHQVTVLMLGDFAAYACGPDSVTCGLLRKDRKGRWLVSGPYLTSEQARVLRAATDGEMVALPVDVDGSLVRRAPTQPTTLKSWLQAGGIFIYPIVFVGALGAILVLERLLYLLLTRRRPELVSKTLRRLERGHREGARELAGKGRTPTQRVVLAGIEALDEPEEEREAAMESALLAEAPRLERSLSLLGALAAVSPLLGLLGTVSGMITTFNTISATGMGNPKLMSGGISEALITTELGLIVAIPLLLIHAWLRRWAERREAMLEYDAIQIFGLQQEGE